MSPKTNTVKETRGFALLILESNLQRSHLHFAHICGRIADLGFWGRGCVRVCRCEYLVNIVLRSGDAPLCKTRDSTRPALQKTAFIFSFS